MFVRDGYGMRVCRPASKGEVEERLTAGMDLMLMRRIPLIARVLSGIFVVYAGADLFILPQRAAGAGVGVALGVAALY